MEDSCHGLSSLTSYGACSKVHIARQQLGHTVLWCAAVLTTRNAEHVLYVLFAPLVGLNEVLKAIPNGDQLAGASEKAVHLDGFSFSTSWAHTDVG